MHGLVLAAVKGAEPGDAQAGVYHRAAEVGSSDLLSQGALDDVGVVEAFEGPKPQVATSHLRRGS